MTNTLALPLDYERLTAKEICDLLPTMDKGTRTAVRSFEQATRGRATVLHRVEQLEASDDSAAMRALAATPPPVLPTTPPRLHFVADVKAMPDVRRLGILVLSAGVLSSAALVSLHGIGF